MKAKCLNCPYCEQKVFNYSGCSETIACDFYKKHLGFKLKTGKYNKFRIIDECKNQFEVPVEREKKPIINKESGIKGIVWNYKKQKWDVQFLLQTKIATIGSYTSLDRAKKRLEKAQQDKAASEARMRFRQRKRSANNRSKRKEKKEYANKVLNQVSEIASDIYSNSAKGISESVEIAKELIISKKRF